MTDLRTALEELVRVTTRFAVYGYGDLRVGKHLDVARAALAQSDDGKQATLEVAQRHGGTDGDHHKAWVIDQMVRALTGDGYDKFVTDTINQANTRLSVENKRLRAALAQSDGPLPPLPQDATLPWNRDEATPARAVCLTCGDTLVVWHPNGSGSFPAPSA
jgi:hypothetical protein